MNVTPQVCPQFFLTFCIQRLVFSHSQCINKRDCSRRHSKDHNPSTRWPHHQRRRKRFSSCNFFRIYVRRSRIKITRQYLSAIPGRTEENQREHKGAISFTKGFDAERSRVLFSFLHLSFPVSLSLSLLALKSILVVKRARFVVVPQRFLRTRSGQVGFCAHVSSIFTVFRGNTGLIVPIELSLFVVRRENGETWPARTRCIGSAARQKEMAEKGRTEKNEIADFASDRPFLPHRLFRNCAFCSLRIVCPLAIFLQTDDCLFDKRRKSKTCRLIEG